MASSRRADASVPNRSSQSHAPESLCALRRAEQRIARHRHFLRQQHPSPPPVDVQVDWTKVHGTLNRAQDWRWDDLCLSRHSSSECPALVSGSAALASPLMGPNPVPPSRHPALKHAPAQESVPSLADPRNSASPPPLEDDPSVLRTEDRSIFPSLDDGPSLASLDDGPSMPSLLEEAPRAPTPAKERPARSNALPPEAPGINAQGTTLSYRRLSADRTQTASYTEDFGWPEPDKMRTVPPPYWPPPQALAVRAERAQSKNAPVRSPWTGENVKHPGVDLTRPSRPTSKANLHGEVTMSISEVGPTPSMWRRPTESIPSGPSTLKDTSILPNTTNTKETGLRPSRRPHGSLAQRVRARTKPSGVPGAVLQFAPPPPIDQVAPHPHSASVSGPSATLADSPQSEAEHRSPLPPIQARHQPPAATRSSNPPTVLHLARLEPHTDQRASKRARPNPADQRRTTAPATRLPAKTGASHGPEASRPARCSGSGSASGSGRTALTGPTLPTSARQAKIQTLVGHIEWIALRCPPIPRTLAGTVVPPSEANRPWPRGLLSTCAFYLLASYDQRMFSWVNRVLHHGAAIVPHLRSIRSKSRPDAVRSDTSSPAKEAAHWIGLVFPSEGAGKRNVYIVTSYSALKAQTELAKLVSDKVAFPLVTFEWLSHCIEKGKLLVDAQSQPLAKYLVH